MRTETSLRGRLRAETRAAIHEAAVQTALSDGLAAVTADTVAVRAGISRRTFFNYFPTKEDAVLGLREPVVPQDAHVAFLSAKHPLIMDAAHLITEVLHSALPEGEGLRSMREAARRFPELRQRLKDHLTAARRLTQPVVLERMREQAAETGPPPTEDTATAATMLASTIVHYTYSTDFEAAISGDRSALNRACETFKDLISTAL